MQLFRFSLPTQFALISLISLFSFIVFSFFGVSSLLLSSCIFYFLLIVSFYFFIKNKKRVELVGFLLVGLYSILLCSWFKDVWVAPSNDDTINHLGFLEAILKSGNVLLGKIPRPGSEFFGIDAYHFYPTGAQGIAAIWLAPFHLSVKLTLKYTLVFVLSLFPGFLWWGSIRAFPMIQFWTRLFLVICASTMPIFPLSALGEGGFSRIVGSVLLIPIWFEFLNAKNSTIKMCPYAAGLIMAAIAPTLLFIHPSLFALIGTVVIFLPFRAFIGASIGSIFGAVIFYFIFTSAKQEVFDPNFIQSLVSHVRVDGWFQRLKSPFHYFFTDPAGFGKFVSPKNYFVYLGIGLMVFAKVSRRNLFLFLLPFSLAALALIPLGTAEKLGIVFYHSVKRIAEMVPLLSLTIACLAAEWVTIHKPEWLKDTLPKRAFYSLLIVLFSFQFFKKSNEEIAHFNSLFATPRTSEINSILAKMSQKVSPDDTLLIDQHTYDAIRFERTAATFTLSPECTEVGEKSDYCKRRVSFGSAQLEVDFWWLPSTEADQTSQQLAKDRKFDMIELSDHAHLIHVVKSGEK